MREIFRLSIPVVFSYLGLMLMAMVDLIYTGHVSATAIGAVGLGSSVFAWVMMFGIGLLMGLDFLVSYAFGAGRREQGHGALIQGLWIAVGLGIPLSVLLFFSGRWLPAAGVLPEVAAATEGYLRILSFSLIPVLLFTACRQYLQALGIARPAAVVLILANLLNVAINHALVLGSWGFESMGANGSAWATLTSRVWMAGAMSGYLVWWDLRHDRYFARLPWRFDPTELRKLLRIGLPAATQMTLEVGVFGLATTLAARLAPESLAAHHAVLNVASFAFMVPIGVGSAAAVLVGQALGRGQGRAARLVGWRCVALGVGFMAFSCLTLLSFPELILRAYTSDPAVIVAGKAILLVAALFQLSDGTQAVCTGTLRGLGNTRASMLANLVGHWGVGLPLGVYLCFYAGWGLQGLWIGLSAGLAVVAASLLTVWARASSRVSREAGPYAASG